MPAQLDDPTTPLHHRRSAAPPYPSSATPLPPSIQPLEYNLPKFGPATLLPFSSPSSIPQPLLQLVNDALNDEIRRGDTYPMLDPLPLATFGPYWFGVFGAVMLKGSRQYCENLVKMALKGEDVVKGFKWEDVWLGSFYIKPNYPGRSSHVCNAGFLVGELARGNGVGGKMGEAYCHYAPLLGYTYSVFNLVYANNTASIRIWDRLGFEQIGRVPRCGNLKGTKGKYIDAIIIGKEFSTSSERVKEDAALEDVTVK